MPLYNYHCASCRDYREYLVSTSAQHPPRCESCGQPGSLERLAVQGFSIGSAGSDRKSPSTHAPSPKMVEACGGKKVLSLIVSTPTQVTVNTLYAMPDPRNN